MDCFNMEHTRTNTPQGNFGGAMHTVYGDWVVMLRTGLEVQPLHASWVTRIGVHRLKDGRLTYDPALQRALRYDFQVKFDETPSGEDTDAPPLYASISINGLDLHLEGIEVENRGKYEEQYATNPAWESDLTYAQDRADGQVEELRHKGRRFTLIATPHGG